MWVLRGFDRDAEELVAEVELTDVPLEMVRKQWDLARSGPGYDAYPATGDRLARLRPYARGGRLDYFLEYDAPR